MISWQEIQKQFKDEWVAMVEWEEDDHGDVLKGTVAYHNPSQNAFYDYLKDNLPAKSLAVRYTGRVRGPFFLGRFVEAS